MGLLPDAVGSGQKKFQTRNVSGREGILGTRRPTRPSQESEPRVSPSEGHEPINAEQTQQEKLRQNSVHSAEIGLLGRFNGRVERDSEAIQRNADGYRESVHATQEEELGG